MNDASKNGRADSSGAGLDAPPSRETLRVFARELAQAFDADSVFLFGSVANGRWTPGSDVDLAVLASHPIDPMALFEIRGSLSERLGMPVDIVSLREASPILAMQVVRYGCLLWDRNPRTTARFLMTLPSRYEDLKRVRAPIEKALKRRLHARH